jgi:hypothetical protein
VFMCFVWISEQTAIISLYSINWLVFITETECVYCAVRAGSLNWINVNISLQRVNFSAIPNFPRETGEQSARNRQSLGWRFKQGLPERDAEYWSLDCDTHRGTAGCVASRGVAICYPRTYTDFRSVPKLMFLHLCATENPPSLSGPNRTSQKYCSVVWFEHGT